MANITALEKCFCSQAGWQKWQLVQALVYLSQVINFSPIKTPTGMMEKVGSLTFLTQASCGTLQCIGCWFLQSPVAENVPDLNTFLPRWLFCLGNKKDLLGGSVQNFRRFLTALPHSILLLLLKTHQKTFWNPLPHPLPSHVSFFPCPMLPPQFLPIPSPLSHSLPPLSLPSQVLGSDFESLFSQFISN